MIWSQFTALAPSATIPSLILSVEKTSSPPPHPFMASGPLAQAGRLIFILPLASPPLGIFHDLSGSPDCMPLHGSARQGCVLVTNMVSDVRHICVLALPPSSCVVLDKSFHLCCKTQVEKGAMDEWVGFQGRQQGFALVTIIV